jgi:hypothetical protein
MPLYHNDERRKAYFYPRDEEVNKEEGEEAKDKYLMFKGKRELELSDYMTRSLAIPKDLEVNIDLPKQTLREFVPYT